MGAALAGLCMLGAIMGAQGGVWALADHRRGLAALFFVGALLALHWAGLLLEYVERGERRKP